ncbi:MAG: TIGR02587 family membrane protein [Thermomicrobiales bacterium]|nr:TIGR02587 family membrane protein [Thermomicrobiales bacterium]
MVSGAPASCKHTSNALPHGSWRDELHDLLRAASGGFLFAVPLLYTLEMWEIGVMAELWQLLVFLGVALVINLALAHSRSGGFKEDTDWFATVEQAVDAIAVGILGAGLVLLVTHKVGPGEPLSSTLGRVLALAAPLSIGAAVAAAIFGPRGDRSRQGGEAGDGQAPASAWQAFCSDLGATCLGAIFLGASIAPTDEVTRLAIELPPEHQIAVVALSLLLSYMIVFVSGFSPSAHQQPGPFQHPITETTLAYVVALAVALASLLLFDRVDLQDPPAHILAMTIVLGLPAAVGGAAGRLVV